MTIRRLIVKINPIIENSGFSVESFFEHIQVTTPGIKLVRPPSRSGRAVFEVTSQVDMTELTAKLSQNENISYAEPEILDRPAQRK